MSVVRADILEFRGPEGTVQISLDLLDGRDRCMVCGADAYHGMHVYCEPPLDSRTCSEHMANLMALAFGWTRYPTPGDPPVPESGEENDG